MKWVSKAAYSALPLRGFLGSNAFELALSVVPQAIDDASKSGLLDDPQSAQNWRKFAVAEAKGQSANLFGVVAGIGVGALVVAAGVSSAPALILIGLVGGAVGQAGFNALGLNTDAASGMEWLLDKF
jgi:hypothetical protein